MPSKLPAATTSSINSLGGRVAEHEEADYVRDITASGIATSRCRFCYHVMGSKDVTVILFVERAHDCPEKKAARTESLTDDTARHHQ
jgi:hypothetical protein